MRIATELAGYTPGQADVLRKAMGKKKPEEMAAERQRFVEGMVKNGHRRELAEQLFAEIERFAQYAFNVAHSAAYALISYQTAYLKAHFPVEFMAALLTSVAANSDKVKVYVDACRQMGIPVLPPSVNESRGEFWPEQGGVRFGLLAVKHVGEPAVAAILAARQAGGRFRGLTDFCRRCLQAAGSGSAFNQRVVESLILAGALDEFGSRAALLAALAGVWQQLQRSRTGSRAARSVQTASLFGPELEGLQAGPAGGEQEADKLPALSDSLAQRLAGEREALGFYLSGHPAEPWRDRLEMFRDAAVGELVETGQDGASVQAAGLVLNDRRLTTKSGHPMRRFVLEDETGAVEVLVFPRSLEAFEGVQEGRPALVWGSLSRDDDGSVTLIGDGAMPLDRVVLVRLPAAAAGPGGGPAAGVRMVEQVAEV